MLHDPAVLKGAYPVLGSPVFFQDALQALAFFVAPEYRLEFTPIMQW
jgi:hypothetical protein